MGELNPNAKWSQRDYDDANILDYLQIINLRLAGVNVKDNFTPIERPGDAEKRKKAHEKAQKTKQTIENTQWEEVK